jgi:hypothetical protein
MDDIVNGINALGRWIILPKELRLGFMLPPTVGKIRSTNADQMLLTTVRRPPGPVSSNSSNSSP